MPRPRKVKTEESDTMGKALSSVPQDKEGTDLRNMPLATLADYCRYNKEARRLNKKLGILRYPVKQCPLELHPTDRIVFGRKDQPMNPLPVYLSNELIEFKMKLIPGKTYDLPRVVIDYLSKKGTPIWKWFDNADGSKETRVAAVDPRFSIRTVYQD